MEYLGWICQVELNICRLSQSDFQGERIVYMTSEIYVVFSVAPVRVKNQGQGYVT